MLIASNDKVLLVRRSIEPQLGKFDLPGGFMDIDDLSMEECVYRELREELGLNKSDISYPTYIRSLKAPDYVWMDTAIKNVSFFYLVKLIDDDLEITPDKSENSEVKWVSKEDMQHIDFAWDIDKKILNTYFKEKEA